MKLKSFYLFKISFIVNTIKCLSLVFCYSLFINIAIAFDIYENKNFYSNIPCISKKIKNTSDTKIINTVNSDFSLSNFTDKKTIKVVAAENFYGDIAEIISGSSSKVESIIANNHADPHLFNTSAKTAIMMKNTDVIIFNGADYDPWIQSFINIRQNNNSIIIDISSLMNIHSGDNPHICYNPKTFPKLAKRLTEIFSILIPENKKKFQFNLKVFLQQYESIEDLIRNIRLKYQGIKVTATEPIFGYMAKALGLVMVGHKFQWVMMNNAEPTPKMLIKYQRILTNRNVYVLFHNKQVYGGTVDTLLKLAKKSNITIIGLTETMPKSNNVITWFKKILKKTQKALAQSDQNSKNSN